MGWGWDVERKKVEVGEFSLYVWLVYGVELLGYRLVD
jgi:heme exporter protein D